MAKFLIYIGFFILPLYGNSQILTTQELESLLKKDISQAQDFIESKGYEYRGGVTDSFFKGTNVIRFEAPTDYKKSVILVYDPKQNFPIIITYDCSNTELQQKKKSYIQQGFNLDYYNSHADGIKYFYKKQGGKFSLAFSSGYDREHNVSLSQMQIIPIK